MHYYNKLYIVLFFTSLFVVLSCTQKPVPKLKAKNVPLKLQNKKNKKTVIRSKTVETKSAKLDSASKVRPQDMFRGIVRLRARRTESSKHGKIVYKYNYGTAIALNSSTLLTAAHTLFSDTKSVEFRGLWMKSWSPAHVIKQDKKKDIALLSASPFVLNKGVKILTASNKKLKPGDLCYMMGFRAKAKATVLDSGFVLGQFLDRKKINKNQSIKAKSNWLLCGQKVEKGFSGGAILNDNGELVGVILGAKTQKGLWSEYSYGLKFDRGNLSRLKK